MLVLSFSRNSFEALDFESDEDDDILLEESPTLDPNNHTGCYPSNPDGCSRIYLRTFPGTDNLTHGCPLTTQIPSEPNTDGNTYSSVQDRNRSFSMEKVVTCARPFAPRPLDSSLSLVCWYVLLSSHGQL